MSTGCQVICQQFSIEHCLLFLLLFLQMCRTYVCTVLYVYCAVFSSKLGFCFPHSRTLSSLTHTHTHFHTHTLCLSLLPVIQIWKQHLCGFQGAGLEWLSDCRIGTEGRLKCPNSQWCVCFVPIRGQMDLCRAECYRIFPAVFCHSCSVQTAVERYKFRHKKTVRVLGLFFVPCQFASRWASV